MARILLIETSTSVLSVALAQDGTVAHERVCTQPRMQASLTAPLVKEVLDQAGLSVKDCDAVCVSSGPGSDTGIPLIAIGTLDILVAGALEESAPKGHLVPMIDARRMEVYTAVYSGEGQRLTEVESKIIGPESFADELAKGEVLFVGDGALKCKDVITHPNARFQEAFPLARHMAKLAQKAFDEDKFENLAYFEPFYLKDFIATVSKKNLW